MVARFGSKFWSVKSWRYIRVLLDHSDEIYFILVNFNSVAFNTISETTSNNKQVKKSSRKAFKTMFCFSFFPAEFVKLVKPEV